MERQAYLTSALPSREAPMATEAGRRLFTKHADCVGYCEIWGERDALNAIVTAERARISAGVRGLPSGVGRVGSRSVSVVDRAAVLAIIDRDAA